MAYTNKNICVFLYTSKTIVIIFKFLVKDCQPLSWKWMLFNNTDQYITRDTGGVPIQHTKESLWRENYTFLIASSLYCMMSILNLL